MGIIEWAVYGVTVAFVVMVVSVYVRKANKQSSANLAKVQVAKEIGTFEPISLYPHINLSACMGSGACITACPEKDVIGIVDGKATIINATSCIGHSACFLACPVDAITLRIGTAERGVELPHVMPNYESNVPGIFIAGELGGMGLIKNATEQGVQAIEGISAYLNGTDRTAKTDLVIVGSGPAGIGAALRARELGLQVRIVDQESLGGTVFTFPRQKVVMTKPMELPGYGKIKLVNTTKQELLDIWKAALAIFDIKVDEGFKVTGIQPSDGGFEVMIDQKESIHTSAVLLAIGRRGTPRKLGVPGEDLPKVTYKLIEPELYENLDILVVGGGDSAVESAMLLMDHNKVTLSYRKSSFSRIKPDNSSRLNEAIDRGKIEVIYTSNVTRIEEKEITLEVGGSPQRLKNDQVFIFAGGELPNAFLKNTGIEVKAHFGKTVRKHRK